MALSEALGRTFSNQAKGNTPMNDLNDGSSSCEPIKHPCDALASLWVLRFLLDLEGWRQYRTNSKHVEIPRSLLQSSTINSDYLGDDELDTKKCLRQLRKKRLKLEKTSPAHPAQFNDNLGGLAKLIGLSEVEIKVLAFFIVMNGHAGLLESLDDLGELMLPGLTRALSVILALPASEIQMALSRKALLNRSGILTTSNLAPDKLTSRFTLMDGLGHVMFEPHADILDMLREYFIGAGPAKLSRDDFDYISEDYELIYQYLRRARETGLKGVNILIHGVPGTGKTELTHTLSAELNLKLYAIGMAREDGDSMSGINRFSAYQLSQQVLSDHHDVLLHFDEMEDVFPEHEILSLSGSNKQNKAWVNTMLEENPVPTLWTSNAIEQIDNAYLRRFDIIVELETPPRKVRKCIIKKYLNDLPVSDTWIEKVADQPNISPAIIERAVNVASFIEAKDGVHIEKSLDRLIGNTMKSMGHKNPLNKQSHDPLTYQLEFLNTNHDIPSLVSGLKKRKEGRVCLYGPPGTGKTQFADYLSNELDIPIHKKHASDILSPYVGLTEQNIAEMFKQADKDGAMILLDEADSFLKDRNSARYSWEVTQVNELLSKMEEFGGIFICTTNLFEVLDTACLRRFDLKIEFDYLTKAQTWKLVQEAIQEHDPRSTGEEEWRAKLAQCQNLTPGDFKTVLRQLRLSDKAVSYENLIRGVQNESTCRLRGRHKGIGYTAQL